MTRTNAFGRPMPSHTSTISTNAARAQLAGLLAGATDERFAGFTVDGLARIVRVPRREIEEQLAAAMVRRGVGEPTPFSSKRGG